jgi:hypothetical protein
MMRSLLWQVLVLVLSVGVAQALPNELIQEGVLLDNGAPLEGQHDLRVRLYAQAVAGAAVFDELHRGVELFDGYYALQVGSVQPLDAALFVQDLYLGISVDGAAELQPRIQLGKVPGAFFADVARNVTGDITPNTVRVGGNVIIDAQGRWVGPAGNLEGPAGPEGPQGPAGPAGGNGSADTPAQVLAKLVQVDGANSGLDADRLDGVDGSAFPRTGLAVRDLLVTADGAGSGVDADRLDGVDSAAFVRTGAQVRDLLRTVDGAGSGVDADRLDGVDSAEFVRTAEQVRDRLRTVDGAGSGVDADRLDGLDSTQFMRADADTGTTGDLAVDGTLSGAQMRVLGNGTFGVGVANPQARVDVAGDVRAEGFQFIPQNAPPANPAPGTLYYDGPRGALRVWDGIEWTDLGAAGVAGPEVAPEVAQAIAAILADGPSAYWKLDEQGGNQAADSSGFGRHGTYVGNVHRGALGLVGKAANIRSAGWVETPANLSDLMPADEGTVVAIIRLPDAYTNFGTRPFQARHHVWSSFAYWQGTSVGTINGVSGVHFWGFFNGSNEYRLSFPVDPGQWVHVAWVHRGGRLYGYVNGIEMSVAAPLPQGSMGRLHIGHYHQDATFPPEYPERIQHVATYPVGLTADQIMAQVQAVGLAGPDGPVASCKVLKQAFPLLDSGVYSLDPDGAGPVAPFDAYCDLTTDGGGWTQVQYLTIDAEGHRNAYASVFSATPLGVLGNGSYKVNAARLMNDASELRYSEPVGDNINPRVDAWEHDFKCTLPAAAKGKINNPGNANQPAAAIECRNLANNAVSANARFLNYQQWSGCWTGPRLWIGSAAVAPTYHGDYCNDCIVTWKCGADTAGVYKTTQQRASGTAAFWVR